MWLPVLVFLIHTALLFGFIKWLRLMGRGHISAPGIYLGLSVLPTLTLLSPSLIEEARQRAGYGSYLAAIIIHVIFFGIGLFLAYAIINKGRIPTRYFPANCHPSTKSIRSSVILLVALFALLFFIHQILSLGAAPLFMIFSATGEELTVAREGGYKLQQGVSIYAWHFSRMVFVPFLVTAFFLRWHVGRETKWLAIFLVTLLLGAVNNGLSTALTPVAMLFVTILIALYHAKRGIKTSTAGLLLVLVFSFPFFVEFLYSEKPFIEALEYFIFKVLQRFSFETFDRTLSYFDYYPHLNGGYLEGRSIGFLAALSNEEFVNTANVIFLHRLESFKWHLAYGNANAHFIGYMNAEGGLLVVAVACLAVGFVVGALDVFASRGIRSLYGYSFYVVLGFILWKLMGSQPTTVLFSHGAVLCVLMIYLVDRRLRGPDLNNKAIMNQRGVYS